MQARTGRNLREVLARANRGQGGRTSGNLRLNRSLSRSGSSNRASTASDHASHAADSSMANGGRSSMGDGGEGRQSGRRQSCVGDAFISTTDGGGGKVGGANAGLAGQAGGGDAPSFTGERKPTFHTTAFYRAFFWMMTSFPVQLLPTQLDDDFCDRLSYKWVARLMLFFSSIIVIRQFVGPPVSCWAPSHFTLAWEDYINQYCWVRAYMNG
jgi:hypothetical protein